MYYGIMNMEEQAMNFVIRKTKNKELMYIQRSFRKDGKSTTKNVERLGDLEAFMKERNMTRDEAIAWGKKRAEELTIRQKEENKEIVVKFYQNQLIEKDIQRSFLGGYLFVQKMYYDMNLPNAFRNISSRHKYEYDLNAIFSDLVYARILSPSSKLSSYEIAKSFLEPPKYELHDVYRALSVLAKESDYIQSEIYKNSNLIIKRDRRILYYDCSNYYFEIEQEDEDGLRRYGKSKEHRPSPIVQMGLFMDSDGIPLGFSLFGGNENEQKSLIPLEKKIIDNYGLEKVIVCTDAGLSGYDNKFFNSRKNKAYIATQSLKKLKKEEKDWALSDEDFFVLSTGKRFEGSIKDLEDTDILLYKEDPYSHKSIKDQRLIITYSPKYAAYQRKIREKQVERAKALIASGENRKSRNPNDPKRFIRKTSTTQNGEVADQNYCELDQEMIDNEAMYDGLYGIVTNLEDDVKEIIKIAEGRWEIEECFRIMKTDFEARPVYLSRKERIEAHFLVCYTALFFLRLLEHKSDHLFTSSELIETLRAHRFLKIDEGFIPEYTRNDITDKLHEVFDFRSDYQIITPSKMRNIIKNTKTKQKKK